MKVEKKYHLVWRHSDTSRESILESGLTLAEVKAAIEQRAAAIASSVKPSKIKQVCQVTTVHVTPTSELSPWHVSFWYVPVTTDETTRTITCQR